MLKQKIARLNKLNAKITELAPLIFAALVPFVGKKVKNADGSLTNGVKKTLEPIISRIGADFQIYSYGSQLCLVFKLHGEGFLPVIERKIYFGGVANSKLLATPNLFDAASFAPVDAERVMEIQNQIEIMENHIRELKSSIPCGLL